MYSFHSILYQIFSTLMVCYTLRSPHLILVNILVFVCILISHASIRFRVCLSGAAYVYTSLITVYALVNRLYACPYYLVWLTHPAVPLAFVTCFLTSLLICSLLYVLVCTFSNNEKTYRYERDNDVLYSLQRTERRL